jgi:cell division initiation protein
LQITQVDIQRQEFKRSMRGYDTVEVDTYLEVIGNTISQLSDENEKAKRRILELETELKNYKEVERTLKQTLMNVQESSNQSRENSKKEADLVLKESKITAAEMVEKARRDTQKLKEEMITLQTQKQSLITRLRHILSSQMELLEVLEIDDLDINKLKDRTKKVFSQEKSQLEIQPEKEVNIQSGSSPDVASPNNIIDEKNPNPEKAKGKDLFKDVFGDNINVEEYLD